jgi:hypothetical protein
MIGCRSEESIGPAPLPRGIHSNFMRRTMMSTSYLVE